MTSEIDEVFLRDFPKASCSKTQTFWSTFAIVCSGIVLNEGVRCSTKQQNDTMMLNYQQFIKLYPQQYPTVFPKGFEEVLKRKTFNGAKKTLWNGQSLLRKYKRVIKPEILKTYETLFMQLFPGGRCPSGQQLEDQALKFREAFWRRSKETANGKEEDESCEGEGGGDSDSEPELEVGVVVNPVVITTNNEEALIEPMPTDFFPPFWLPFVVFGSISKSPNHIMIGTRRAESAPLSESVPNRSLVRALASAERHEIIDDKASSKKRKADVLKIGRDLADSVNKMSGQLNTFIELEAEENARKRRVYEISNLKSAIDEATEDGDDQEVLKLKMELRVLRAKPLQETREVPVGLPGPPVTSLLLTPLANNVTTTTSSSNN